MPRPRPRDAPEAGQTWVAQATTGADGLASFPLQFPGYAYCAVETQAPADYVLDTTEHCTPVLEGDAEGPTPVTTLTVSDPEALVTVSAYKFDSATPDTGIPGAVYDLYVEGPGPPSGPPSAPPTGAAAEEGDTWWGRGTTDASGALSFSVPAGYAWCFHEASAPTDYVADPALHCTAVLSVGRAAAGDDRGHRRDPGHGLPRAPTSTTPSSPAPSSPTPPTSCLEEGTAPPGYDPPPAPAGTVVPTGDTYWTQGTTDAQGRLSFAVPAGFGWCLRELAAPSGYMADTSLHCTAVLTSGTATDPTMIALPEQPVPPTTVAVPSLAFTGGPSVPLAAGGLVLVVAGGTLVACGRRRRRRHPGR